MQVLRRSWRFLSVALILTGAGFAYLYRNPIIDWWALRDYTPSAAVASLADDGTMTDYARKLFYVNDPAVEGKEAFNRHCGDHFAEVAVLGCYQGDRLGIFVYDIQDDRLAGVEQVTAAHEMLHQAYDRLSDRERNRIDTLLHDFYKHHLKDQAVKDKLASYNTSDNRVLVNEMHSIFGTQVRDLTPELEAYYARYFTNRTRVVAFSDAYQAEFTRREEQVKMYDDQLHDLKIRIDANEAALDSKLKSLKAREQAVAQYLQDNDVPTYQQAVASYNALVDAYNTQLQATKELIETYNAVVKQRNEIALQEQELQQALDSRQTPAEKQ